jgi:hypothetical protein
MAFADIGKSVAHLRQPYFLFLFKRSGVSVCSRDSVEDNIKKRVSFQKEKIYNNIRCLLIKNSTDESDFTAVGFATMC